jgi:MEMO1 family protein
MRLIQPRPSLADPLRRPAVAGSFYPAERGELGAIVDGQLAAGRTDDDLRASVAGGRLAGILVPHAGLVYSGWVAATAWTLAASATAGTEPTIVLLGTNHGAGWLDGVGVWECGAWRTPFGDVEVDEDLAAEIVGLGRPFVVDRDAHRSEHSIEVQLPFVQRALTGARIVPLSVATGRGALAIRAGLRLGSLVAARRRAGAPILVAISTDMAHYPPAVVAERITDELAPLICAIDPGAVARRDCALSGFRATGIACGMCGIEPTVVGLTALRTMGVVHGTRLAAATSADVGGPAGRTVGYLAVAFPD